MLIDSEIGGYSIVMILIQHSVGDERRQSEGDELGNAYDAMGLASKVAPSIIEPVSNPCRVQLGRPILLEAADNDPFDLIHKAGIVIIGSV